MKTKRETKSVIGRYCDDNHTAFGKRAIACLILVLGLVSTGYGDVILGDWESADSNDDWIPGIGDANAILVPASTKGVTLGSGSLKVTPSATGDYWILEWEGSPLDLTDAYLQFDLTMVASEWPVGVWTKVADKIAINSNGTSGWKEWSNLAVATDRDTGDATGLDWGRWWDGEPDVNKTYSLDVSDYDATGAAYMQIHISTQGYGGTFYFDNARLVTPDMIISKCKVKAGKVVDGNQGNDAIDFSGIASFPADLNDINLVNVSITSVTDDELIYSEDIDFNATVANETGKFKYSYKIPRGSEGAITSLKFDFVKGTFAIKAKNVDLTGLASPVQLDITMGDYVLSGEAEEDVINSRKTIPTRLMRTYQDTLIVTKAKAKSSDTPFSDSLSVKGDIAVADINDEEPNLVAQDVNVIWGDQTFTIPTGNFIRKGNSYKCSKIPSDGNDGLVTAKFDLDKCTFTLSVKEANDLNIGPDDVQFGINFADFNEVDDVNVVLGY